MSAEFVHLLTFAPEEIIFDDDEIKEILLFFFPGYESSVNSFTMNHTMREFAQGLLVEAVDASYAMGFVEIIFRGAYGQPGKSATAFLKTFARKAAAKWFKHAKATDLATVKIYDTVRRQLRDNFLKSDFIPRINGTISKTDAASTFVDYASVFYKNDNHVWT